MSAQWEATGPRTRAEVSGMIEKNRQISRNRTRQYGVSDTRMTAETNSGASVPRPVKYRRRTRIINDGLALARG